MSMIRAWLRGRAELGLAALVTGIGIFLLVATPGIPVPAIMNVVSPRFFPYVVGGLLVVVGVILAVTVWLEGSDAPEAGEDVDPSLPTDWRALVLITTAFVGHIVLLEPLGFVIAEALLFTSVAAVLGGRRRLWLAGLVGLALSSLIFLLFALGLGVALPAGLLEGVL